MEGKNTAVEFEYNGKQYAMTAEEIEAAYRYREHQYLLEDAKRHLKFMICFDSEADLDDPELADDILEFEKHYETTVEEAMEMLEDFVDAFKDDFTCDIGENMQWYMAICNTLKFRVD